jgi:hypothetical protein
VLDSLGNVGDFIGGIAVVVTLVYLAVQIRQNTKALETASRQAISEGYRASNRLRIDPEAGLAWAKGLTSFADLSFSDRNLFSTVIIDEALFFQGAFALYESGQLDDSTYIAYLNWFSSIIATPGGSHWWETTGRPIYTPGMIKAVDERLAKRDLPDIRNLPALQLDMPPAA